MARTEKLTRSRRQEAALTEKLALTIPEASELSNVCRSNVYLAVQSGALRARKLGRSTLILQEDLRSWVASFPDYSPSPDNSRQRRLQAAE
jgi:excisionase family DNA binding protein